MPAKKKSPKADLDLPEIEDDLRALESIIEEMEESRIPLNQLVKKYEEGSILLRSCMKAVGIAKERIEVIQVNLDKALEEDHNSLSPAPDDESPHDGQLL